MAKSLPERICGSDYSNAVLTQDWYQDMTIEDCIKDNCLPSMHDQLNSIIYKRIGKKYCATSKCSNADKTEEIRKCISQTAPNLIMISTYKKSNKTSELTEKRFVFASDDLCYEDCKSTKSKFLSLVNSSGVGLERVSCQKCFEERDLNTLDFDSYLYPEIGKRIFEGQVCYSMCKDPEGSIVTSRKLSGECQKCVGINGNTVVVSHFIKRLDGYCYEVINKKVNSRVPIEACKEGNVGFTTLVKEVKSSFANLIWGGPTSSFCYEVDDETNGEILHAPSDSKDCLGSSDNSSRTIPKDNSAGGNGSPIQKGSMNTISK
jgi:hypothetical protein